MKRRTLKQRHQEYAENEAYHRDLMASIQNAVDLSEDTRAALLDVYRACRDDDCARVFKNPDYVDAVPYLTKMLLDKTYVYQDYVDYLQAKRVAAQALSYIGEPAVQAVLEWLKEHPETAKLPLVYLLKKHVAPEELTPVLIRNYFDIKATRGSPSARYRDKVQYIIAELDTPQSRRFMQRLRIRGLALSALVIITAPLWIAAFLFMIVFFAFLWLFQFVYDFMANLIPGMRPSWKRGK